MLDDKKFKEIKAIVETKKIRQRKLLNYYLGKHDVLSNKETSITLPNRNNIVVNNAYYISELLSSFITSKPIEYAVNREDEEKIRSIIVNYQDQDISSLDIDLATNLSIFGEAWEYLYFSKDETGSAIPKSVSLEAPFNCYIEYSNDVEKVPQFGVYWSDYVKDTKVITSVRYVDNVDVIQYEVPENGSITEIEKTIHTFGYVPLIKYSNNKFETGDFEQVISIIDAINTLQSNRVNDKTQFINSILTVNGAVIDKESIEDMKTYKILNVPTDAKVSYVSKQLDETGTQVLTDDLKNDLHKISMTPNMSDVNFSANASGVAMKYKLLQFNQLAKKKANFMGRGLKKRLLMYSNALSKDIKLSDVDVTFSLNLPVNEVEIAQIVQQLQGIVGQSTLLNQLPFVLDADEEIKEVNKQRENRMNAEMNSYQNTPINKDVKIDEPMGK